MVDRLKQMRQPYSEQQNNLHVLQSSNAKSAAGLETKLFKVLKGIGIGQSSYHGGSLNGKNIKKVISNAINLFGKLSLFSKLGKRDNCELSNTHIDGVCHYFQTIFVLWNGAFSFARKINPMEEDAQMYRQFVDASVTGHVNLGLTITPRVHFMLKHVWWQMENIRGGFGNKMEDWVEKQHQVGKQERACFRTMKNLQHCANVRAWVIYCNLDLVVISQMLEVDGESKHKFNGKRAERKH
jgi:hypothetical protein